MDILDRILPSTMRFRRQLMVALFFGVTIIVVIVSIVVSVISGALAKQALVTGGINISASFSDQSALALIFSSPENAEAAAQTTLAFPDIQRIIIFTLDGGMLFSRAKDNGQIKHPVQFERYIEKINEEAVLVDEKTTAIYFMAPVHSGVLKGETDSGEDENLVQSAVSELLGYVFVDVSKQSLVRMQNKILLNTAVTSLVLLAILLYILSLLIKRITKPIQSLSAVMRQSESGVGGLRADMTGPAEIVEMAHAFNVMMAALEERDQSLRRQKDVLEESVAKRTQELVEARDVALRESQHKSQFLANISHELRTPMNAIIGYTDMVIEELAEEDAKPLLIEDLNRVQNAANHLLVMINNILDLSKLDAGMMKLHHSDENVELLLREAVDTVQPLLRKNGNALKLSMRYRGYILTDAIKFKQIIINLLSNAGKYTHEGHVEVHVYADQGGLCIEVRDDGIGISAEQQSTIFEEFVQADNGLTREYGGTGLGLSISRKFCELMGGRISVESTLGVGTCFKLWLPMHPQA